MRPIADNLIVEGAETRLLGGRRLTDGGIVFPLPQGGEAELFQPHPLKSEGVLWSWTVQRFPPKSPPYAGVGPFRPYVVGYVAFEDEVIVEGRIVDVDVADVRIGMTLQTTAIPFDMIGGETVLIHAFRPASGV